MITEVSTVEAVRIGMEQLSLAAKLAEETRLRTAPPPDPLPETGVCDLCGGREFRTNVFQTKQQRREQYQCPNGHIRTAVSLVIR